MGKHLATLLLFRISFYPCLRILHFLSFVSPPRAAVLIPHAISCTWLCVFVCEWVLRSLATVWSALTLSSSPCEKCSFSLIPVFYSCTRHYLVLDSLSELQNQTWYTHHTLVIFGSCCDIILPGQKKTKLFYTGCKLQLWDYFWLGFGSQWRPFLRQTCFFCCSPVHINLPELQLLPFFPVAENKAGNQSSKWRLNMAVHHQSVHSFVSLTHNANRFEKGFSELRETTESLI